MYNSHGGIKLLTYACSCLIALAGLSSCQAKVDLPELPEISTVNLIEDVNNQIINTRALLDQDPLDAALNGQYGLVMATYGRDEAAHVAFTRARLLAPKLPQWSYYHSYVLRRMGQTTEALEALNTGLRLAPGHADLLAYRGELLFEQAQFNLAKTDLQGAVDYNPKYAVAQYYLARIDGLEQNWSDSADKLRFLLEIGISTTEVHFHLASAYRALGDPSKAKEHFALAEQNKPFKIAVFNPIVAKLSEYNLGDQPHVSKASAFYRRGEIQKALEELKIAHRKNPENAGTHVNLIRFYGHTGDLENAKYHYDRAIKLDPNLPQSYSNMGFAYQFAKDFPNAVIYYKKAIEQNPDDATSFAELGYALLRTKQTDDALASFERSLELQPANRDLRYIFGESLLRLGRSQDSIEMLNTALLPQDQKTAAVFRSLAKAQVQSNDKEAALKSLHKAHEIALEHNNTKLAESLLSSIEQLEQAAPNP